VAVLCGWGRPRSCQGEFGGAHHRDPAEADRRWRGEELGADKYRPSIGHQLRLGFAEIDHGREVWEYAVLVTSLDHEILSLGQLY
jgi:hypothetical protein